MNKHIKTSIIGLVIILLGIVIFFCVDKDLLSIPVIFTALFLFLWLIYQYVGKKDFDKNIIFAIGFALTIVSWFITGYLNNETAIREKKRDLKVKYLLNAYYRIENMSSRYVSDTTRESNIGTYIYSKYAESALGQIGLLADTQTIRIANEYILDNKIEIHKNCYSL